MKPCLQWVQLANINSDKEKESNKVLPEKSVCRKQTQGAKRQIEIFSLKRKINKTKKSTNSIKH